MGGSLVQPENKFTEKGAKSTPCEKETSQQISDQIQETPSSKLDPSMYVDLKAHCKKAEDRDSSSQMINQGQDESCSKVDLSVLRDHKNPCSKADGRKSSSHMITQAREKPCSKMDLSGSQDGQEHCSERENSRDYIQQMSIQRRERSCSKLDLCISQDGNDDCSKDENREFSQLKSDRRERLCSKGDLSISKDGKDHCDKADNGRQYSQQRERMGSKIDLCLSRDNKDLCSYGEDREFSQQKRDRREKNCSKGDLSISGDDKDHCNKAESREFRKQKSDRRERHSAKGNLSTSKDGKDHANKEESRACSQPSNQRQEIHCSKVELSTPRDFKEQCNKREYSQPMVNQRQERPCSKMDLSIPKDSKDHGNTRENRECSQQMLNPRWERPGSKVDFSMSRESKDQCSKRETRECSQPNTSLRRERTCSKEDVSICQDYKDHCSKRENREFIPQMSSKIRARPSSRMDYSMSWDSTEQGMKNTNRAQSSMVYADPFKTSETMVPEQSNIRLSNTSNMAPYLRGSIANSQPLAASRYEDQFQNEIDKVRNDSATTIQSCWRGYTARRELYKQYDSATIIQAAWRGYNTRKKIAEQDQAATVIQANYRGHQTRKDLNDQEKRAVQIQNDWREFLSRQLADKHSSSIAIQAHYRDPKSRAELFVKNHAAILIQSHFKGYKTRKAFQERKKAAINKRLEKKGPWMKKEPPTTSLCAAKSSSGYSLHKYSSGSRDSSPESGSKSSLLRTVTPESSYTSTDQTSNSCNSTYYGNHARKPQGKQQQQSRDNVLEAIGQGPVSSEYSPADSTEDSEKDDGFCQNPCVGRPEQKRPLYKYEAVEKKPCPATGGATVSQVCGRTLIPRMPLSIPYSCRRTVTRAKSPELSQDRGRERKKPFCDTGWAEQDARLPFRRDYKCPVPTYSPDTFRRRLTSGYPLEQSNSRMRDRRKSLYDGKLLEQDKYLHCRPENKPPVPASSPPTCRRKMACEYSPDPPNYRERTPFSDGKPHDQEKQLPCRQEPKPSAPPSSPDPCRRKPQLDCSPEQSPSRVREKPKSSYESRRHEPDKRSHCKPESKPRVASYSPETHWQKVTCSSSSDEPQNRARELKTTLCDSRQDEQDKRLPYGQTHKPPVPPYSPDGGRRKSACGKVLEQSQDRERAQSNYDRGHNGQDQPPPSKPEPRGRKPFQQTSHAPFGEGTGSPRKSTTHTQLLQSGGGEFKTDLESRKNLKEPSKRTSTAEITYTGGKMRTELGSSSSALKEISGKGMVTEKIYSNLVYPTSRSSREPAQGMEGATNATNNAIKMPDKYVFKSRKPYRQEIHAASTTQSLQTRLAIKHQHEAATQIQALYRGYKARQYLQAAGILNQDDYDDDEDEVRRKEPTASGDAQHWCPPSWSSPKSERSQRRVCDSDSWFHPGRRGSHAVQDGNLSLRYNRRSLT